MRKYKFLNQISVPMKWIISLVTIWIPCCVIGQRQPLELSVLERMNVNREFITLSGFSSGGTFAQQLYFSYSSLIHGIGVFSHAYYRCGPISNVPKGYDDLCTTQGNRRTSELYDPNLALRDIHDYFKAGLIENPRNMANKPFYVTTGTRNWIFTTDMSLRVLQIFEPFINNVNAIHTRVTTANHSLPSDRPELPSCSGPPNDISVSNCGFSAALDSLQFLLGKHVVQRSEKRLKMQPLLSFDQTEFFYGIGGSGRHDMDNIGFMYIPTVCKNADVQCYVHFYFHGCMTGRQFVGAEHIMNSGFMEVGEENGIIMIFPQALNTPVENDIGCWDTYGFTGPLYATKRGGQVTVVRNMLARILGEDGMYSIGGSSLKQPNAIILPTLPRQTPYQNVARQRQQSSFGSNGQSTVLQNAESPRCSRFTCRYSNYYSFDA